MKFLKPIELILDNVFLPNKHIQNYINNRHNDAFWIPVRKDEGVYYRNGCFFGIHPQLHNTLSAFNEYIVDDIKTTDIVLDVGACIGGFTIPTAHKCRFIYSVEPLFYEELKNNVELNKLHNVSIITSGLGNNIEKHKLTFFNPINHLPYSKIVEFINFKTLRGLCNNHIDFLKMDCEGGEWGLTPKDLEGIRRIEIEVHNNKEHKYHEFLNILDEAGFSYTYDINIHGAVVHAKRNNTGAVVQ